MFTVIVHNFRVYINTYINNIPWISLKHFFKENQQECFFRSGLWFDSSSYAYSYEWINIISILLQWQCKHVLFFLVFLKIQMQVWLTLSKTVT